ncbi:MAG: LegC family aminotransferase [Bacteroidota bacterium]
MIPLSEPNIEESAWMNIQDCLSTGWVSSAGSYVDKFEQLVARYCNCRHAVATVNGTSALHIALLLSNVRQGEYVITSNVTFVATANAIKYTGADPIFIDIDRETWQMNLDLLEAFLKNNTVQKNGRLYHKNGRAISVIIPVHVLGNICDMDRLKSICDEFKVQLVEDAAESLGSKYNGVHAGTLGSIGCLSFNGNKIITTGGGGMILTNDEELAVRAKHLTTQAKSDPLTYFHDEIGYNYRMVNILAALGVSQMESLDKFIDTKRKINNYYTDKLSQINDITFQKIGSDVETNYWLYTILSKQQCELSAYLQMNEISCRPLWTPMNRLPMFKKDIYINDRDCSYSIHSKSLSLPSSSSISTTELDSVINRIHQFYSNR